MSQATSFRCPVCRARQARQPECRRCGADLILLVGALQWRDELMDRWRSIPSDTAEAELLQRQIQLLSPKSVADF